ncbi:hypothetical protein [Haloprofundus sp. MHR1]|uniref:DUF7344 domain-containing protein n=1 Tax=Haloprofundus sp. MHR1 TaxID=2572921 RepID=UPI0010BECA19|nr:hypothetical protein [Haloprofundus sp. MHR1]QCJ45611.1 hypothetical protein FCF25_00015 [Haloprofundus sp. MHR1]
MSSVRTPLDAENEPTLTELFDALADERRRRILDAVERADPRLPVALLANALAPDDADEDDVRTLRVSLVHSHLPRLDDAGLLSYDRDDRVVSSTPTTTRALSVVDAGREVPR